MAFIDSDWGFTADTLTDPSGIPDSAWGRTVTTLVNPTSTPPSGWGTTTVNLTDREHADSGWGRAVTALGTPHYPIGVFTPEGLQYVPIVTFDGFTWR